MTAYIATLSALFASAALALALWTSFRRGERMAVRVSRQVGLALPPEPLREKIARRVRRTALWTNWCAAVGAWLGILPIIAALLGGREPDSGILWIAFAGFVLGASVGGVLAVLTERRGESVPQARVARATRRTLRDYLDPLELDGARVTTGLAVLTTAATLLWPATQTPLDPAVFTVVVLGAAGVIALVVLEVAGRRVVLGRSRIAESPAELAWDDALRSVDLRRLVTAVLMTSLYAVIFGAVPLLASVADAVLSDVALMIVVNVGMWVFIGAAIAVAVIATLRQPGRYYLRRLWPAVAAQGRSAEVAR